MDERSKDPIATTVAEPTRPPPLDLVLAYGAMVPLVLGALGTYLLAANNAFLAQNLTLLFSGAILVFLSGVRRGISFRTPGGARGAQIGAMLWIFVLGFLSLFSIVWGFPFAAAMLQILGFVSIAILDAIAARREDVPAYFERLRPPQTAIAVLALAAVALRAGGYV